LSSQKALVAGVDFVPGELLIRFEDEINRPFDADVFREPGIAYSRTLQGMNVELWHVPEGRELDMAIQLSGLPGVRYVELNYFYQIAETHVTPNDPEYPKQWAHQEITNAEVGWEYSTGSSQTIIAIIDSGIDLTHPDLSSKILTNLDRDYFQDDDTANDQHGHGTHVAGIAAAIGNNGVGVAGVDWQARLLPLKVCGPTGTDCPNSDIAEAITYASNNDAEVINISLSGSIYSQSMQDAINTAYANGALIVAAMGNDNTSTPRYPAAYTNVFAVSATDRTDVLAYYSNFGDHVDIAAPGGETTILTDGIYSTLPTYNVTLGNSPSYGYLQGTSMAAPYVSGLAALIWATQPSYTNDDVQYVIEISALDLGAVGWDQSFGSGRVDVQAALELALPLFAPALAPIHNTDLDGNYLLDWLDVTDASALSIQYEVEVDDNPAFSSPSLLSVMSTSQYNVTNQPGGVWYYRVRSTDGERYSIYGNTQHVNLPPQPPSLSPISNPDNDGTYTISWSASATATKYLLEEDDDPNFGSPINRFYGNALNYNRSYQPSGAWYYRVRAESNLGLGPFSTIQSVLVNPYTLEAPIITPITNHGSADYIVDWNDVSGAFGYWLEESISPYFESPIQIGYIGSSQYVVNNKMQGQWFYRVRTIGTSASSPWSATADVYVGSRIYLPINVKNYSNLPLPIYQDFESATLPPQGWTLISTSASTWDLQQANANGGQYNALVLFNFTLDAQDEILLSPYFTATSATLSFVSYGEDIWCTQVGFDNCELNVWIVVNEWGGGDDIFVMKPDDAWTDIDVWHPSNINLTPLLPPNGRVRLGFEYLGSDGFDVGLDNILISTP
jgi:subtilisin family serine protease